MLSKLGLFIEGKSLRTQKTYGSTSRSLERFMHRHGYKLESMAPYAMKQWVTSFKSMNSQACAKRFSTHSIVGSSVSKWSLYRSVCPVSMFPV